MIKKDSANPEIYLFLSVDIIDSTSLKYGSRKRTASKNWYNSFISFYQDFPSIFSNFLKLTKSGFKYKSDIQINLWKYAGDEILFYVNIQEKDQIPAVVDSFKRALQEWYDPSDNKEIQLKGCIWIGQFPFIDRRLLFSNKIEDSSDYDHIDFIGPSIDCGFRLGKYATRSQIVLSIEVVDVCRQCKSQTFKFYYIKSEKLKGVLDSLEYPIFVLILNNANRTPEEKHLLYDCHDANLANYIDEYYQSLAKGMHADKISRIEYDISHYLDSKKEISKKVIESDSQLKPQELQSETDKQISENPEEYEELSDLISKTKIEADKSI